MNLVQAFENVKGNNIELWICGSGDSEAAIREAASRDSRIKFFGLVDSQTALKMQRQATILVNPRTSEGEYTKYSFPSKTIPQGLSAMLAFDPESNADDNRDAMMEYMSGVSTGSVTFAARNSEFGGNKIKEGEIIALNNGKLTITDKDPIKATVKLIKSMISKSTSYITLIYGEDISEEQARMVEAAVNDKFGKDIEVTIVNGGQPVYYFLISIE